MESIRKFLVKHGILIFVLAIGCIIVFSVMSSNNLNNLYEKHLKYITSLAGRNLQYIFNIYYNDLLVEQHLRTLKEEIRSAEVVYLQLSSKEFFYPKDLSKNYLELFKQCQGKSSTEVINLKENILVCTPLYSEVASTFVIEREKEGTLGILYSKHDINNIIAQWLLQNVILFIIFTIFVGVLFFDMLMRINKNFNLLSKIISQIEDALKENSELLSDYKSMMRFYLNQFSFREFFKVGDLLIKLVSKVIDLTAELRQQALRDPLTKLYNRNYLNQFMDKILGLVKRQGLPLSVVLMDIDDFKYINDTFGHAKGDEVLKTLGKIILTSIRNSDIAVRFGGEEILLILPNTKKESALYVVNRIKQKLSNIDFGIGKKVTFSAGVAGFPEDILEIDSLDKLINIADERLYVAKRSGKNTIVLD
ncbi:MAG: GGDEF domain-containing protein [Desulfurobacteriaceae bacterium]